MSHPFVTSLFCAVGVVTCAYYVFTLLKSFVLGFRGFVVPQFVRQSNKNLVKKYGSWAGKRKYIALSEGREVTLSEATMVEDRV